MIKKTKVANPRNLPLEAKHTPYLDAWTDNLVQLLEIRGKKAELATFVANKSNRTQAHTQPIITRLAQRKHTPSAELLLSINAWIETQK